MAIRTWLVLLVEIVDQWKERIEVNGLQVEGTIR